jgi:hypothetical protein
MNQNIKVGIQCLISHQEPFNGDEKFGKERLLVGRLLSWILQPPNLPKVDISQQEDPSVTSCSTQWAYTHDTLHQTRPGL